MLPSLHLHSPSDAQPAVAAAAAQGIQPQALDICAFGLAREGFVDPRLSERLWPQWKLQVASGTHRNPRPPNESIPAVAKIPRLPKAEPYVCADLSPSEVRSTREVRCGDPEGEPQATTQSSQVPRGSCQMSLRVSASTVSVSERSIIQPGAASARFGGRTALGLLHHAITAACVLFVQLCCCASFDWNSK